MQDEIFMARWRDELQNDWPKCALMSAEGVSFRHHLVVFIASAAAEVFFILARARRRLCAVYKRGVSTKRRGGYVRSDPPRRWVRNGGTQIMANTIGARGLYTIDH